MAEMESEHTKTEVEMTKEIFFGVLVSASMIVHIKHLQSKSYAEHMALGGFYEGAPQIIDSIIETYQGAKDVIVDYDEESIIYGLDLSAIDYLKHVKDMIMVDRFDIIPEEEQHIHNELDELLTLIDSTIYKLTFLK